MTYTIRTDGTDCATATIVQVVIDAYGRVAVPVPEGWRGRFVEEG
jgi:acyl-CoA thioesterase FadM